MSYLLMEFEMKKRNKTERILDIYTCLLEGEAINRATVANKYNVDERTILRDIEDIRTYLHNRMIEKADNRSVFYNRALGGYRLE